MWEILEDAKSEEWFAALKRLAPAPVLGRFLDGEDGALTADEMKAVAGFAGEFGYDMRTNRLIRRTTAPPVPLGSRATATNLMDDVRTPNLAATLNEARRALMRQPYEIGLRDDIRESKDADLEFEQSLLRRGRSVAHGLR